MVPVFKKLFQRSSRHRISLESYLKKVNVTGNILDIGGAQKSIVNRISPESKISDYRILDLPNPHSINSSKIDYKFDIQSSLFNPQEIKMNFSAIFCLEVSLYWHDPNQALRNIVGLMNTETKLYINFHQFYANQKPVSMDMLRYSSNWIEKICKTHKLRIIETRISELSKFSLLALNLIFVIERMRLNKEYSNHNSSSFLLVLEIAND
jgi:hypothetical protein